MGRLTLEITREQLNELIDGEYKIIRCWIHNSEQVDWHRGKKVRINPQGKIKLEIKTEL